MILAGTPRRKSFEPKPLRKPYRPSHLPSSLGLRTRRETAPLWWTSFRVAVRSLKMRPVWTSFECPWQNGVAECWVESCRRDLLDHVIAVNGRHLKRLLSDYVRYYCDDRTHLGLSKETQGGRVRVAARG